MSEDSLARALDYPYPAHPEPFLFKGGRALPLPVDIDLDGLTPIVAVGSNRAPVQLARKFAGMATEIPVTRLIARDVDVVYAAHMAGYGSIPATLAPSPGVAVELWITWLDGPTLRQMDRTEAVGVNYERRTIGLDIVRADPEIPTEARFKALVYAALRGAMTIDGIAVPLAVIPATGRTAPVLTERQVLEHLYRTSAAGDELFEGWLRAHIGQTGRSRRTRLTDRLAATAIRPTL